MSEVYKAIATVMSEMSTEGIAKGRKNQQQHYQFRGIDDIYNALAKKLSKANLCILPRIISRDCTERKSAKGGALFCVVVDAEFDFISSKDGSKHTVKTFGEAMDSADKATNKAMSAAYKYACMQAFCIPTEGDNDADANTHEALPTPKPSDQAKKMEDVKFAIDGFTKEKDMAKLDAYLNDEGIRTWTEELEQQKPEAHTRMMAYIKQQREKIMADDCPIPQAAE